MLKRKFNKKEKIILKIYIHYILKKKIFNSFKKNSIYRLHTSKKILFTNKYLLETILNKKYVDNITISKSYHVYCMSSIH